ncbi:hypothetical protein Taro_049454, partial [Colocasia esculenta]|nr:hypothetical protein [Colocasia esculenta]
RQTFPTEPVTREAHPYPPQVRARRRFLVRRPVPGRVVAVQGQHLQQSSSSSASARSREADSDQVRYRFNRLGRGIPSQLVSEQEISEMADRRDWGGGGDDPEESTQRMIERIWESLTDIRARLDQQAPVPPVRARRTFLVRRPVPSRVVAVQGQHLQQSSSSSVVL